MCDAPGVQRAALALTLAACHSTASPVQPVPPAPPPSCMAAADHVASLYKPGDARAPRARDLIEKRCDQDHWDAAVRACFSGKTSLDDSTHCKDRLTPTQRAALELEATAPVRAPQPTPDDGLPAGCHLYAERIEKLTHCDQVPQATRDALQQAYEQTKVAWASVPADGLAALEQACISAADALQQAGVSVCGW
jgi:hypothetical protein